MKSKHTGLVSGNPQRYPVPALDKGLDVLELLASHPHGLNLSDLAHATSRKVGEIFRMVDGLKRRGYIALDPRSDRLQLTMRLFELAHRYPPTGRLISASLPQMQALAREVGQSCHVAIHSAGEMLVIAQVDSPRRMGFAVHVGARVGLTSSASGRAFLAFQPEREATRLLVLADNGATNTPCKAPATAAIRKKGFVSQKSDFIRGVTNMSYPILDFAGHAVAAITVPYLHWDGEHGYGGLDVTRMRLGAAARSISSAIGGLIAGDTPIAPLNNAAAHKAD